MQPAKGTALRIIKPKVIFAKMEHGGSRAREFDITEVRRLLRTDMTVAQICSQLGCVDKTLKKFIKRRNLCDLRERDHFIRLQRSLQTLDE